VLSLIPGGDTLQFAEPVYLWLLLVPAALLCLWARKALQWRGDARRLTERRVLPVQERYTFLGAWPYWLLLAGALGLTIVAAARPAVTIARTRTAGVDLVILQDGSASMHVADVAPDRWQRSMRFVRSLAESLQWKGDRLALALFARMAAPQVRLTRDPNTFFFFLDHIEQASPFPLKDDTTWDTNIELGIYWGARLIERDEELNGASGNSKAFVLISDGQAWSGEVDTALGIARERGIPVYVVGVGSERGGYIPEPKAEPGTPPPTQPSAPVHARLDRRSLVTIATAGRGTYFDLGSTRDRDVANAIVASVRRRAGPRGIEQRVQDLYWPCLAAAALLAAAATVFLRDTREVGLQVVGLAAALLVVWVVVA
jgi:Ca-activated chloride channel family protein